MFLTEIVSSQIIFLTRTSEGNESALKGAAVAVVCEQLCLP